MALSGSFTTYTPHETETEIISSSVTYPADLSADHEHYSLRGTTQIVSSSHPVMVPNTHSNKYIVLKSVSIVRGITSGSSFPVGQEDTVENDTYFLNYEYEAYNSKTSKESAEDPFHTNQGAADWDWTVHSNPFNEAYTNLSSSLESDYLINV